MLWRISAFAGLGGFLFGYDLGLIGGAMLELSEALGITGTSRKEAIVGAAKFGAFFGTFIGGALMLRYGRRKALALESVFFVLGPIIMAASYGTGGLVVGRLVVGLGIGASAIVVPAYLAEISPAARRGAVVQMYEVMLCVGMLVSVLMDWLLKRGGWSWRWMVGLPALPGTLMAASLAVLPESPRWLVLRGRLDDALDTLHKVLASTAAGAGSSAQEVMAEAEDELLLLWSSVEKDKHAVAARRMQLQRSRMAAAAAGASFAAYQPPEIAAASADYYTQAQGPQNGSASASFRQQQEAQQQLDEMKSQELPMSTGTSRWQSDAGDSQVAASAGALGAAPDDNNLEDALLSMGQPRSAAVTSAAAAAAAAAAAGSKGSAAGTSAGKAIRGHVGSLFSLTAASGPRAGSNAARSSSSGGRGTRHALPGEESSYLATLWAMLQDVYAVACGPERRAFLLALGLAFFDQACASTAVINYAPELLKGMGVQESNSAVLYTAAIAITKAVGVFGALAVVDSWGRRPLLIGGSIGCGVALAAAVGAAASRSVPGLLLCLCAFTLSFSFSWAGGYWVVVSEIFSMGAKSPATSAAAALLFLTGSVTNLVFLSLVDGLGPYAFLLFSAVTFAGAIYVHRALPETKGRTLVAIQAMMSGEGAAGGAGAGGSAGMPGSSMQLAAVHSDMWHRRSGPGTGEL